MGGWGGVSYPSLHPLFGEDKWTSPEFRNDTHPPQREGMYLESYRKIRKQECGEMYITF